MNFKIRHAAFVFVRKFHCKVQWYFRGQWANKLLCRFCKAHSTQHALFKFLQAWEKELENSGFIGIRLKDLSKAYHCLPDHLLIAKLGAYGLGRSSLRLLMDYLNAHKKRTKVGSLYSKWAEIKCEIPQGSILGLVLFNIFINDLFFVKGKLDICNFVDNTLYFCGANLKTVLENLTHDASKLLYCFKISFMKANPEKFQFIILSKSWYRLQILSVNTCNNWWIWWSRITRTEHW